MNKRIFAAALACVLALALCLPALAAGKTKTKHVTPAGYNDNDYQKMAAFLDTQISVTYYGMTMTKRIYEWFQMIDSGFSMQDPSSWDLDYNDQGRFYVHWIQAGGEYRISEVMATTTFTSFNDYTGGSLDLSDCAELELFTFNYFKLDALDLSGCVKLVSVECRYNNTLASIDLSGCALLNALFLDGCPLAEIDLSDCPLMPFDRISANGSGTVYYSDGTAYAVPGSGSQFFGWYSENGQLITQSAQLSASSTQFTRVSAHFTGAVTVVLGDADGNGAVDVQDALMVLRAAMSIISLSGDAAYAADVNGDGSVTVNDALQILRKAMGLIQQF